MTVPGDAASLAEAIATPDRRCRPAGRPWARGPGDFRAQVFGRRASRAPWRRPTPPPSRSDRFPRDLAPAVPSCRPPMPRPIWSGRAVAIPVIVLIADACDDSSTTRHQCVAVRREHRGRCRGRRRRISRRPVREISGDADVRWRGQYRHLSRQRTIRARPDPRDAAPSPLSCSFPIGAAPEPALVEARVTVWCRDAVSRASSEDAGGTRTAPCLT